MTVVYFESHYILKFPEQQKMEGHANGHAKCSALCTEITRFLQRNCGKHEIMQGYKITDFTGVYNRFEESDT